jgi:N-acetylglucosamine malate deacetylase 1
LKLHILAIAAHPDDIELSCGATLTRHVLAGDAVGIVDLTEGELGTRGDVAMRYKEAEAAAAIMGIKVRMNAQMADGFFKNDEEHQRKLIKYIRYFQPDIVLGNALEDRHPDHGRAGRLIADSCFLAGLRKVETEWEGLPQQAWRPRRVYHYIQDRILQPDFIVDVTDVYEKKMAAIASYKSQFHDPSSTEPDTYISSAHFLDFIRYRDALFGKRIGTGYGEGFISGNTPGINSLNDLLLPELA